MLLAALAITTLVQTPSTNAAEATAVVADQVLEWFAAAEAGQIEVKFIPKDATVAMVLVKNLTDKPVTIKLPEAFAAVPINAQGMMGGGGMGGMMRVAPEKQMKMRVATVCLEHGKPDPNPKMAYKMIPVAQFTSDARVIGICQMLGHNLVTQNTAQAAAWHLTDNLSWEKLASKNRVESKYTGNVSFFTPFELRQALTLVSEVTLRADSMKSSLSSSTASSSSSSSTSSSSASPNPVDSLYENQ